MKKRALPVQKIAIAFRVTLFMPVSNQERWFKRLSLFLANLDNLNRRGIVIKVSWVIPLRITLRPLLKKHPELIEHIKYRVDVGYDDLHITPSNYAPLPLMERRELILAFNEQISNEKGDGIKDIFKNYEAATPLVGQLYSPDLLPVLSELGIKIATFPIFGAQGAAYSYLQKNYSFFQQHNPLWLMKSGSKEKLVFLNSYGVKDIEYYGSLKKMILKIRQEQVKNSKIDELLVFFDFLMASPLFYKKEKNAEDEECLLEKIIEEVAIFPFIYFTTATSYVAHHNPKGILTIDRDCLFYEDGQFSDWADKWETREIWSNVERSRIYCQKAISLAKESGHRKILKQVDDKIKESDWHRLNALSLCYINPNNGSDNPLLVTDGIQESVASYQIAQDIFQKVSQDTHKVGLSSSQVSFRASLLSVSGDDLQIGEDFIENSFLKIQKDKKAVCSILIKEFFRSNKLTTLCGLTYDNKKIFDKGTVEYISSRSGVAQLIVKGKIYTNRLKKPIPWQHLYTLCAGLPYLFINISIDFSSCNEQKICEIMPALIKLPRIKINSKKLKIWKDSPLSSYGQLHDLDNYQLEHDTLFHSQIERSWVAFEIYGHGLLLAQKRTLDSSFGFCPVEFHKNGRESEVFINPMGSYKSKFFRPLSNPIISTIDFIKQLTKPFNPAVSYDGKSIHSSFMIAPFSERSVPEKIISDAYDFSSQINEVRINDKELEITG